MEFFAKLGVAGASLLDSFPAYKTRLVLTVIGCNNEVNPSVNAYNITNVRNITFFHVISYRYVKIILAMPVYELSSTKLMNILKCSLN